MLRHGRSALELPDGLGVAAKPVEQVGAGGGQQVIGAQCRLVSDVVDERQAGFRSVRHCDSDGPVERDDG